MSDNSDNSYVEDPAFLDAVDKAVAARADKEKLEKERAKPPKDFADAASRFADAVWDRFEERKAAARQAEQGDEAPDRSDSGGDGWGAGFLRSIGGAG